MPPPRLLCTIISYIGMTTSFLRKILKYYLILPYTIHDTMTISRDAWLCIMLLSSLCLHVLYIVSTQDSITTKYIKNPSLYVTKPCLCGLPGLIVVYFKCTCNIIITTTDTMIIIIIVVLVHCTRIFEHVYNVYVYVRERVRKR